MLTIVIPKVEHYDDEREIFLTLSKEQELTLEHSLISLSKWESKWHTPFLSRKGMTREQEADYIRCMTINKNVDDQVYSLIPHKIMMEINEYIKNLMTATTIRKDESKHSLEIITSEIIYYWMVNYSIPFECERWHLNRLLMLINVCSVKNQPKKKVNQQTAMAQRRALNDQRLREYNTTG